MSTIDIDCWLMEAPREPLQLGQRSIDTGALADDQVVVEVAGCGVCHTDLGFFYDGVRTRHPLPLTLGHEIAGTIVHAADPALLGRAVVVPAVMPCGDCLDCQQGRGAICKTQIFPGNDVHGGFASHVVVPAKGLCLIDEARLAASGVELCDLSVIADAVTTAWQAILDADLCTGDLAVFIGIGGVGGFGVQIARAIGAHAVAIDIDAERLELMREHGAEFTCEAGESRALRKQIAAWAKAEGYPTRGWRIFETSGSAAGQKLAFGLLNHGAHLGVVGYTRDPVEIRLSNIMAFAATARGTWGCLPEHYPDVIDLVLNGEIRLDPFVERRAMSTINDTFDDLHRHALKRRPVLVPDFSRSDR